MKHKILWLFGLMFVLAFAQFLAADDPTSRFLPLPILPTGLPAGGTGVAVQVEVWDQVAGGSLIFAEAHTVDTDSASNITNDTGFGDFLLGRPGWRRRIFPPVRPGTR